MALPVHHLHGGHKSLIQTLLLIQKVSMPQNLVLITQQDIALSQRYQPIVMRLRLLILSLTIVQERQ